MQDATPFKFLFLTAVGARNLKNVQMIGKQDPYLKLWVGRAGTKVQTCVDDGGGSSATWGGSFKFSVERLHAEEYLYFKVKNKNVTDTKTIGSGKVAIKTFGPTMQGKWYKLYDPNGRDAGKILLEGRLSRRGDENRATGEHGQNLPNTSAGRAGAPTWGPTAPMAMGAGGAHSYTQQHAPMNQSSMASSFSPPRPVTAVHYGGSNHHYPGESPVPIQSPTSVPSNYGVVSPASYGYPAARASAPLHHQQYGGHAVSPTYAADSREGSVRSMENFSPVSSNTGTAVPSMPNRWGNTPTSASAPLSNFRGHKPSLSMPSAPVQPHFLEQRPNHDHGGAHSRRASNTGTTTTTPTASSPVTRANRPATARAALSSYSYPGPTAPPSLPTPPPAQPSFLGQRSSHFSAPQPYGGPRRLPHGWEEKVASTGRTFYVDHTTKTTSWVRPGEASHGVTR